MGLNFASTLSRPNLASGFSIHSVAGKASTQISPPRRAGQIYGAFFTSILFL